MVEAIFSLVPIAAVLLGVTHGGEGGCQVHFNGQGLLVVVNGFLELALVAVQVGEAAVSSGALWVQLYRLRVEYECLVELAVVLVEVTLELEGSFVLVVKGEHLLANEHAALVLAYLHLQVG